MARIESWFEQDLKKPVIQRYIKGNFFSLDNVGNLVGVKVYDNGAEATLSGSVTGYCVLADGTTVPVSGTRSGNQAYILLPQSALSIPGYIGIVLKLTDGNTITTLLSIIATVYPSQTDEVITPSSQVITDWSQQISVALQEVEDASAAQDAKIDDLKSALNEKASNANALSGVGHHDIAQGVYFEEENKSGGNLYFKFASYINVFVDGAYNQIQWNRAVTDLEATLVVTPNGVPDCLQIPNNMALVFDIPSRKMKYVDRTQTNRDQVVWFFNAYGRAECLNPALLQAKIFQVNNRINAVEVSTQTAYSKAANAQSAIDILNDSLAPGFTPIRFAEAAGQAVIISAKENAQISITTTANTNIYVSGKNMLGTYKLNKYYTATGGLETGLGNAASPAYHGIAGASYTISVNKTVSNIGIVTFDASGTRVRRYNNQNTSKVTVALDSNEASFACWIAEKSGNTDPQTDAGFMALQPQVEYGTEKTFYESGTDPVKYTGTADTAISVTAPAAKNTLIQAVDGSMQLQYTASSQFALNVYNVKTYGAVGDGITDDTQAIQNALNDAHISGGGTVFLPIGTYFINTTLFDANSSGISSALHIYNNTTMLMDAGTVLLRGPNVNHMIYTHNNSNATGYDGASNIIIRGGVIDENSEVSSNDTALNITHAFNVLVDGVTFRNAYGWHYIEINSSNNIRVHNCNFLTGNNSEDIQIDAAIGAGNLGQSDGTVCQNIEISGCYFNSGAHPAVGNHSDAAHHDIRIHGCVVYNNNNRGAFAWVALTHAVDMYDNTIYANVYGANFASAQADSMFRWNRLLDVTTPVNNCTAVDNIINGVFTR